MKDRRRSFNTTMYQTIIKTSHSFVFCEATARLVDHLSCRAFGKSMMTVFRRAVFLLTKITS